MTSPATDHISSSAGLQDDHVTLRSRDYKESFEYQDADGDDISPWPKTASRFISDDRRHPLQYPIRKWLLPLAIGAVVAFVFWLGRQSVSHALPSLHYFASEEEFPPKYLSGPRDTFTYTNGTRFEKPADMKIIGIIFYGRRQFVDILDCYLRRNLAVNGGMLDEIHFLLHTEEQEDIKWLQNLIRSEKLDDQYKLKEEDTTVEGWSQWNSYPNLYKQFMSDPDTMYIKMDDDLVHIDDYAISELIRVSMEHPEAHSVQSNNINNRWSYWHHFRLNAVYPYLADSDPTKKWSVDTWRPSQLPRYQGTIPPKTTNFTASYFPPFDDHRWLPLDPTAENLASTPYGLFQPPPEKHTSRTAVSWAFIAQTHYSFFENLERNELGRYDFGNAYDHTFNLWYSRWNINLMAIRGSYILKRPFWTGEYREMAKGDEFLLTQVIPKDLGMPAIVATRAMASHYSFHHDRKGVLTTDILDRYRAYANEMVCPKGGKKTPFGPTRPHNFKPGKDRRPGTAPAEHDQGEIGDGPADAINPDDTDDTDDGHD